MCQRIRDNFHYISFLLQNVSKTAEVFLYKSELRREKLLLRFVSYFPLLEIVSQLEKITCSRSGIRMSVMISNTADVPKIPNIAIFGRVLQLPDSWDLRTAVIHALPRRGKYVLGCTMHVHP